MKYTNMDFISTNAVYMSTGSCMLSIIGSFAIFGSYILVPDIQNSTRKLITCLTVADVLTAFGYLISAFAHFVGTQDKVCTAQSVITTYSSMVSFYLTVAIAIHIFSTVVYRSDSTSSWKFLLWANIISWIIPGIITGVAGADNVLGRNEILNETDAKNSSTGTGPVSTGPWCWLNLKHNRHVLWMFLAGKGWEFLCYLITSSLYVLLKFYTYLRHRRQTFTDIHESLREEDQNYLYVWFVLYVIRLWGSVRTIMYIACKQTDSNCKHISDIFMYFQAIGDPGQAFCNCILFCFLDNTVRTHIFHARCCSTTHDPDMQEDLIADPRICVGHGNEQDELMSGGQNRIKQYGGDSVKYSSFGITKPESFTRSVQKKTERCSRNASVRLNSPSAY